MTALAIAVKYYTVCGDILSTLLLHLQPTLIFPLQVPDNPYSPNLWWRLGETPVGQSPLHTAVSSKSSTLVAILLDAGFEPDNECFLRALELNRAHGQTQITTVILAAKHPCAYSEAVIAQAFEDAIESGDRQRIKKLISFDLELNCRKSPSEGWTPLQLAAWYGDSDMAQELIAAGASINAPPAPQAGATALQAAAILNKIGIVRTLLELGAEINAPRAESYGRTALEGAAAHGRLDMVSLLLEKGAKTTNEYRAQYIGAIGFASKHGHHAVVSVLKNHREWTDEDTRLQNSKDLMSEFYGSL
ncbi:ankyrin repeat-containing domain protein [Xylariaceae sp. FL1272]|nr:ankyrin repeat-containing domain protein [Xylariaceae sp. FL1272]